MTDSEIRQLKSELEFKVFEVGELNKQVGALTISNSTLRNEINWSVEEMKKIGRALGYPMDNEHPLRGLLDWIKTNITNK